MDVLARSTKEAGGVQLPPLNLNQKSKKSAKRGDSAGSQQGVPAALRILEPARKKLGTVETQRIVACLDETIRRHEIVALLPSLSQQIERFSIALGDKLTATLNTHKSLCDRLDKMAETRSEGEELNSIRGQVSQSCKNVMRQFSINPQPYAELRKHFIQDRMEEGVLDDDLEYIEGLKGLRALMLERLLTTPTEELDRTNYLKMVTAREQKNTVLISQLQSKLDEAIDDKEEETNKRNETVRRLKNDLHQIEQFSEEHIRRTRTEAEKQQSSDVRNSEGKQVKLKTEIAQLEDNLTRSIQEHREAEMRLRKKKFKIETEVENWIQKYDQDMGDRQNEYEQIDTIYTEEKKQLSELEEKFKVLEEEYTKIMEERRIAKLKKEQEEKEHEMMTKAAVTIQAFFRAYKVRKALKSKGKKGKGKGKGKKGKK